MARRDVLSSVFRGACARCPNCGRGRLFRAYLKPVETCAECHESLKHIRADDGPAWLTILVVGHIVVRARASSGDDGAVACWDKHRNLPCTFGRDDRVVPAARERHVRRRHLGDGRDRHRQAVLDHSTVMDLARGAKRHIAPFAISAVVSGHLDAKGPADAFGFAA